MRSIIRNAVTVNTPHRLLSTETATAASTPSKTVQTIVSAPNSDSAEPDKLYSKLEIELKGNDPAVLKSYSFFANTAAAHLGIEAGKR